MIIQRGSDLLQQVADVQRATQSINNGVNTMNNIKFTVAAKVLSTYNLSIVEVDHGQQ